MGKFLLQVLWIFISGFFIGASAKNFVNKNYFSGGLDVSIGIVILASYIMNYVIY